MLADQDRNVALRWANKSDIETDVRPDVIILKLVQHDLGHSLGFGEVKAGNTSTTKHSICLDVVRLGIMCKWAIDHAYLAGCIGILINGFHLSFFMGVPALGELVQEGDWMTKIDLKDAYTVVPIHHSSRPFLSFEHDCSASTHHVNPTAVLIRTSLTEWRIHGVHTTLLQHPHFLTLHLFLSTPLPRPNATAFIAAVAISEAFPSLSRTAFFSM